MMRQRAGHTRRRPGVHSDTLDGGVLRRSLPR